MALWMGGGRGERQWARTLNKLRRATHVVLSDQRQELAEGSGEVGTEDAGERANEVGSVRDERRLVLGRVALLVDVSLVLVGVLLAESLALEDLGGVRGDLLEVTLGERRSALVERLGELGSAHDDDGSARRKKEQRCQ